MTNLAIEVSGLSLKAGKPRRGEAAPARPVLNDIQLAIPAGAVVGLVGRNGAGKSSLMRCLLGLSLPDAGSARVLGCPSSDLDDATRARIGHVSQGGDLLPWLQVWQHVEYIGGFYPRWQAEHARALCHRLGLPERTPIASLSPGEQQRLAIVLALAHDPDLLVLDEPVASLDPLARRDFMRLLFEADFERATPRTMLLSSHLLSDLERVVSHVVFLREGRVQLQGAWDDLLEQVRWIQLAPGAALPRDALATRPGGREGTLVLVDHRGRADSSLAGQALPLEELFVELNT